MTLAVDPAVEPKAPNAQPPVGPPTQPPASAGTLTGTSPGKIGERIALAIALVLLVAGAASYDEVSDWGTLTDAGHQYLLAPILGGTAGWLAFLIRQHEISSGRDAAAAAIIGILGGVVGSVAALAANKDASPTVLGFAALISALAGAAGIRKVIDAGVGPAVDDAKVTGDQVDVTGRNLAVGQTVVVQDQLAAITAAATDGTSATARLPVTPTITSPMRVEVLAPGAGVPVSKS